MRRNFGLMEALATYTRVGPADRIQRLRSFNDRLMGVNNVVEEFSRWNLSLDRDLVTLNGRIIKAEDIIFRQQTVKVSDEASWQKDMRDLALYTTACLNDWAVLVPRQFRHNCEVRLI